MVLAVVKGLTHSRVHEGPIASTINNILLQLFGQVTTILALFYVSLSGLCSFVVASADVLSVIIGAPILIFSACLIFKEVRMTPRVDGERA